MALSDPLESLPQLSCGLRLFVQRSRMLKAWV